MPGDGAQQPAGSYNGALPSRSDPVDARTRLLLIAVQFCFGVFPWLGKVAFAAFEPRAVLLWRLTGGAAVLLVLAARVYGRAALPPRGQVLRLALLSVLGITVNQWLFLEGLAASTAVNAGLLMAVIPVATAGFGVAFGGERLSPRRQLGIALGVGGVAALFVTRGAVVGGGTLVGDLLLTVNAVSYSGYLVLAKPTLRRMPRLLVVAWVFAFGALSAPLIAAGVDWVPAAAGPAQWLALAGILLFPTILAYVGNIMVLARTEASTTAAYVLVQPFISGGLGILLLGERPDPWLLPTAVAVLSGLWLVSVPGRRRVAAHGG